MMTQKYKLAFIEDDDGVKREVTARLIEEFEIVDIPLYDDKKPLYDNVYDLANDIVNAKLDAVIIDYSFVDKTYDIKFTGADLVAELETMVSCFPIFMLSGKSEAENSVYDVNLVYNKAEYLKSPTRINTRIRLQIENCRKRLASYEARVLELIDKSGNEKLSAKEEEELIKLDNYLEKSNCMPMSIPAFLKESSNFKKLNELIESSEKLISEIERR